MSNQFPNLRKWKMDSMNQEKKDAHRQDLRQTAQHDFLSSPNRGFLAPHYVFKVEFESFFVRLGLVPINALQNIEHDALKAVVLHKHLLIVGDLAQGADVGVGRRYFRGDGATKESGDFVGL